MTESEWLICADPQRMLDWLTGHFASATCRVSDRKLRLFACACCRQVWHLLSDRNRHTVEVAERFIDGLATDAELLAIPIANVWLGRLRHMDTGQHSYLPAILYEADLGVESAAQAALLRDIIGNPWRRIVWTEEDENWVYGMHSVPNPDWLSPTVLRLARGIYDTRDFAALSILADALEDVGCDNEAILMHLRGHSPHARGCWALDLVLGKE